MKAFYLGSNENKNSGKDLSKIDTRFAEKKYEQFENKAAKMLKC